VWRICRDVRGVLSLSRVAQLGKGAPGSHFFPSFSGQTFEVLNHIIATKTLGGPYARIADITVDRHVRTVVDKVFDDVQVSAISSSHPLILSPPHPLTPSSSHPPMVSSSHRLILSPSHPLILSSSHPPFLPSPLPHPWLVYEGVTGG
jgi:hypothetical protein